MLPVDDRMIETCSSVISRKRVFVFVPVLAT